MKKQLTFIILLFLIIVLNGCKKESEPKDNTNEEDNTNEPTKEEIIHQRALNILETMTLEEKIGQMFMVGFEGTSIPNSLNQAIVNQRFGNFIYFGANVADDSKVASMSSHLQNEVMEEIKIPAFISMDQEGGMVVRFAGNATHFIGNMGLVATGNSDNAYNIGKLSGQELRHYGVNVNLAPSLDVNNNPANPVIGIRSYSDNPQIVSEFGLKMIKGLKESDVLSTVKHFPGHGDTVVDSHYGLPLINHDKERLYSVELAPFIAAINDGVDAIMTAHIIFQEFDSEYPATLSYKVLTEILREELGFQGIIITDEMRMNAIRNNFGIGDAAIMSIKAGADMLLYAESTSTSLEAYEGVLNACINGNISEERINSSVIRILEKKLKYGLFEDYQPRLNLESVDFLSNELYNRNFVEKSITLAKGNVNWFSKDRSTLLISSVCTRYPLIPGYSINTNNNSLAFVGKRYLNEEGVKVVDSYVIGKTLSDSEINNIIMNAKNYEQVIIAVEDVSSTQATLINNLNKESNDLLVIALKNPYDFIKYDKVDNYICSYGYFADSVQAIMDLLLGKFTPSGVLPVKVTGIN